MGSTAALWYSASGIVKRVSLATSPDGAPWFQPQGRRSVQTRPWLRNSVQKAPNWNQRTYNSPLNCAVGTKPPMSVPQYGMPVSPALMPMGTWLRSVSQSELTSPDHRNRSEENTSELQSLRH